MRRGSGVVVAVVLTLAGLSCSGTDGKSGGPASQARKMSAADEKALKALRSQAEIGDSESQYRLGLLYLGGMGVPQDPTTAVGWWGKAAQRGHVEAQLKLGHAYREGRGVPADAARAFYWYMHAAQQDSAAAQYNVGYCYAIGYGVPRNLAEAARWYERAAENGDVQSRAALARLYASEEFTRFSPSDAYKWLMIVWPRLWMYDEKARAEAEALKRYLEGFLTDDEQGDARRAADDWRLRHPKEVLPRPVVEAAADPRAMPAR